MKKFFCVTYMHLLVAGSLFLGKYLAETYGTCLCAGDYNILLNPKLDTTNQVRRKSPLEKQILQELGLFYIWGSLHQYDREFSFYSARHNI